MMLAFNIILRFSGDLVSLSEAGFGTTIHCSLLPAASMNTASYVIRAVHNPASQTLIVAAV